jgi:hypothetical protein
MVLSPEGLKPSGTALARASSNNKFQTRPLVREGATEEQTRNFLKTISRRKKGWSRALMVELTPDRLAD